MRIVATFAALAGVWAAANWMVQTWRKPTEMFFPVGQALVKSPAATWRTYGPLFRKHSTPVISPELLAALAQIEGAGNPVARPRWTWRWSRNPFEWYRPASSAVGMFQVTDAAFRDAKRYCIHDHAVVEDGPWATFRMGPEGSYSTDPAQRALCWHGARPCAGCGGREDSLATRDPESR